MFTIQAIQPVAFDFSPSKVSQRTTDRPVQPPGTANAAQIFLQSFDVEYTNHDQYGFGKFQVDLEALSTQTMRCTVTLRDNNENDREWQGRVEAIVLFVSGS